MTLCEITNLYGIIIIGDMMNANCLLFYGNDSYLLKQKLNELFQENEILSEDIENYDYEEDGLEVVITSAMTLPFFANKKAVVLRNCVFLTEKKKISETDYNTLEKYVELKNPTTIFVMVAPYEKLDQRKKITKFLTKNIETKSFVTNLKSDSVYDYIRQVVSANHQTIESLALTQFVNRIGNNPLLIENELQKLITYAIGSERITSDMVYQVVTRDIDDNIYQLVNAYLDNNLQKTIDIYHDLKSIKIDPIWILGVIVSKFQEILYTKELIKMRYSQEDISKYFRASKGRTYYIMQNARNVDEDRLYKILEETEKLDYRIKSGQIDKFLGLELFLLKNA